MSPRVLGISAGLLAVAFLGWSVWAVAIHDPREDIDLSIFLEDSRHLPHASLATEELCNEKIPCVQALQAETMTLFKFASRDHARSVERSLGEDAHRAGWIVVRYEPETPNGLRQAFEEYIDCINTWETDDGRRC